MDASEIIKRLQTKTDYSFYKQKLAVTSPTVNISTCGAVIGVVNFPTYSEKQSVLQGKLYCSSCTNSCGC